MRRRRKETEVARRIKGGNENSLGIAASTSERFLANGGTGGLLGNTKGLQ